MKTFEVVRTTTLFYTIIYVMNDFETQCCNVVMLSETRVADPVFVIHVSASRAILDLHRACDMLNQ